VAEQINPTAEHEYWKEQYANRPYVAPGASYEDYGPAYQYGWESRGRSEGKKFEDVEPQLSRDWDKSRGQCPLKWQQASPAVRDGWEHVSSKDEVR